MMFSIIRFPENYIVSYTFMSYAAILVVTEREREKVSNIHVVSMCGGREGHSRHNRSKMENKTNEPL
jgi:hypothetical protein